MEDRNFIIFTVLTIALIMVWMTFFAPKPKPKPAPGDDGVIAGSTVKPPAPQAGSTTGPPAPQAGSTVTSQPVTPKPETITPPESAIAPAAPEEKVTVSTDVFEVEFSNYGAAPTHWRLSRFPMQKCFKYRIDVKWPPLTTNPECNQEPVDLADTGGQSKNRQFMSEVSIGGIKVPVDTTWEIETKNDLVLGDGDTAGEIVFRSTLDDGRVVRKIFRFRKSRYDVSLRFAIEGEKPVSSSVAVAMFYSYAPYVNSGVPRWNFKGPEVHNGKTLVKMDPDDLVKEGQASREAVDWTGFSYDYFETAVLSTRGPTMGFVSVYLGAEEDKKKKNVPKEMVGWTKVAATPEELEQGTLASVILFMGPKQKDILSAVRPSLRYSIDYGRLKVLVLPLIEALVWIDRLFNNYGVSIIVLTIILRMGMFPLTRKSQQSMKEMQKLQPEIQKIKEKYPDDKVKQNEEMQALWRKHSINPMMGCLPMLLQFPVFFAFYKALLISIELRQAPFFGWIIDLSERDPLYIWPLLMGGTQFITQKLTPNQMDPMQQKVFLVLPLVFMYLLRDFPSGLLIYWTVQNLVGIGQQIYVNKKTDQDQRK